MPQSYNQKGIEAYKCLRYRQPGQNYPLLSHPDAHYEYTSVFSSGSYQVIYQPGRLIEHPNLFLLKDLDAAKLYRKVRGEGVTDALSIWRVTAWQVAPPPDFVLKPSCLNEQADRYWKHATSDPQTENQGYWSSWRLQGGVMIPLAGTLLCQSLRMEEMLSASQWEERLLG